MKTTKLTDIFSQDRYPHQAEIALGGGESLRIQYRATPDGAQGKTLAFVRGRVTDLGFDADVVIGILSGRKPTDEEAAAFIQACEALEKNGEDGQERISRLALLANGFQVSLVLGGVTHVSGKSETPVDDLSPEACAAFPADAQRTIVALAEKAVLPSTALDFLGMSPRS